MMLRFPRFVSSLQPVLGGELPLIVTGPRFKTVSIDGQGRRPFWRLLPGFVRELRTAAESLGGRDEIGLLLQALMEERIVEPHWVVTSKVTPAERLKISIAEFAAQVPVSYHSEGDLGGDIAELLDGMSAPEYFKTLFGAHGDAEIEPQLAVI